MYSLLSAKRFERRKIMSVYTDCNKTNALEVEEQGNGIKKLK